tara:strand:- start:444 stop:839 length:396 start_codon:yes stop_codon:yes gene_type:complete
MSKNSSNNQNLVNIISKNTIIDGSIRSESDVRVDGTVKGTLITKAKVVVGQGGVIEGDVASNNADISGKVQGKMTVAELLKLNSTSVVEGDIITNKLIVEAGAQFNGNCRMGAIIKEIEQAQLYEIMAQES